ncbi:MAG: YadA C-terminal domain-containing protein [Fusobacterium necrophorum]|nr:YadA C-terminal domain-containing protein [Fusobacterium necrophorum]
MKGALNRKINISLSIAAVFLMTDSISFASSKSLQENYPKDYFENKVSKSINDIVDDNFSKTLIFGLPNPVNIGVKSGIKSIFSILDKKFPELKPLLKLTGYDLNTFPEQKLFHFKELHGQKVAAEFQKTNKAFNEAEKKWAETSHFVMKNKSVLDEHEQKIKENTSAIGSLKSNLENNYYTKEEVYSQTEVDTKLGEHDQRITENSSAIGGLKSNLENNYYTKEEVYSQMEIDTKIDTKVDKKEFYDYQHNIKKDIENTKSEIRHVGSLSAALSGLHPMQYDENNPNQIMASLGSYRDKQAVAVGLTHYFKDNLMMTGGLAVTDDKKIKSMVSLGITYKFGKGGGNIHNTSAHDFGKAFEKLAKENNEQKIQLDKQVKENADLKDIVQNQSQEIQEIKKQLKLLLNKK